MKIMQEAFSAVKVARGVDQSYSALLELAVATVEAMICCRLAPDLGSCGDHYESFVAVIQDLKSAWSKETGVWLDDSVEAVNE